MQVENSPNEFALYCIHQSGGNVEHWFSCMCFHAPFQNIFEKIQRKKVLNHNLVTIVGGFFFPHNSVTFVPRFSLLMFLFFMFVEKRRLSSSDLPLWERVLEGPSNSIIKMFLMDVDEQEVSLDVRLALDITKIVYCLFK